MGEAFARIMQRNWFSQPDIDEVLIGGASLTADDFIDIIAKA